MITLFPDQDECLHAVRESMARRNKAVLLQAPTGSGKTVIAASLVHGSRNKGTRCMMVVPRLELLRQSELTFEEYQIPFSYCAAGRPMNLHARTFLATSGTLLNRIRKRIAPEIDLLIIDETHYGGAGLNEIIAYYKARGTWIIGLSATPSRLDGKGLDCWYDDMVQGPSIEWLIRNKRLSDYRLFAPSMPDISGIKTVAGDFARGDLAARMEADKKNVGNAVQHYRQHAFGKLLIVYTASRLASEIACQMFRDAGVPASTIDGEDDDATRKSIIRSFARRELLALVNCDLLTFGFDLSAASGMDVCVEAMSDLRPTQSLALQMQKWGRALRKKDEPALIFDHAGNAMRHGLPDDEREWSLQGRDKKKGKGDETRVAPTKQCSGGYRDEARTGEWMRPCYFTHRPAPRCPNCGAWYEIQSRVIEEVDGQLTEMKRPALREPSLGDLEKIKKMVEGAVKNGVPQHRAMKWAREKVLTGQSV